MESVFAVRPIYAVQYSLLKRKLIELIQSKLILSTHLFMFRCIILLRYLLCFHLYTEIVSIIFIFQITMDANGMTEIPFMTLYTWL